MNLRCEVCHKLVNTLIRSQCFTCYERTRRRARAAKTRAHFKIRLFWMAGESSMKPVNQTLRC